MGKIAAKSAVAVLFCLLLPIGSATENIPDDSATTIDEEIQTEPLPETNEFIGESEIGELCPSLTKLPLMTGRPAPCLATYQLF